MRTLLAAIAASVLMAGAAEAYKPPGPHQPRDTPPGFNKRTDPQKKPKAPPGKSDRKVPKPAGMGQE